MGFDGFGPETFAFLRDLTFNNDRGWFDANRGRYEAALRAPAEAFIMELGALLEPEYPSVLYDTRRNGAGSLMRIYRDIRFSPDKRPFKENVGIIFPLMPGKKVEAPIFYFHVALDGCFFYGGQHVFTPEILERYRRAVDLEKSGTTLEAILADLGRKGLRAMEEPTYKRTPRGYSADHPRSELLKRAAVGAGMDVTEEDVGRPDLPERCREAAFSMRPLMDWIGKLYGMDG